jgi:hypothetical protein
VRGGGTTIPNIARLVAALPGGDMACSSRRSGRTTSRERPSGGRLAEQACTSWQHSCTPYEVRCEDEPEYLAPERRQSSRITPVDHPRQSPERGRRASGAAGAALIQTWPNSAVRLTASSSSASSRGQLATLTVRDEASLTWASPSIGVRWCPPPVAVIVTHLVTRSFACPASERLLRRTLRCRL